MDIEPRVIELETRIAVVEKELELTARLQQQTAANLDALTQNVSAIIEIHNNVKGTITVIKALQNFALALMKWPLIAAGAYSVLEYIKLRINL